MKKRVIICIVVLVLIAMLSGCASSNLSNGTEGKYVKGTKIEFPKSMDSDEFSNVELQYDYKKLKKEVDKYLKKYDFYYYSSPKIAEYE